MARPAAFESDDELDEFLADLYEYGLPLATFNTKDFVDFAANEGLQLIDGGQGPVRPT